MPCACEIQCNWFQSGLFNPCASHYQNLIKVEPKEVKTAETVSDMTLPRVTAQIQIKKVEKGTNNPMEGISFHIWSDNGFEQWIKTDGNGIFRLEGLLPGTYQYQEEVVEEYVKNQEIYTFTVLEDGTVSGQVGSEHTSFSVENLRYCDLTVIKQIKKADIVWAHGNPTFLFSISGANLNGMDHTYYGCIQFTDEDVKKKRIPKDMYRYHIHLNTFPWERIMLYRRRNATVICSPM